MDNWVIKLAEVWKEKKDVTNVFGVVVYTDAHPHLKKVLADEDYWKALDTLSGPNWPIFAIRPAKGTYGFPELPPGQVAMMIPVYKESVENEQIVEAFNIRSTDNPVFVIFCMEDEVNVLSHRLPLTESSVEDAYSSLKNAVSLGTDAVAGLKNENRKNAVGAYNAVAQKMDYYYTWSRLRGAKSVVSLFLLFKGLLK